MKYGDCQFAPNGETPRHAIRVAQRVIHNGESVHEAFAPQAFRGTRAADVAILLDHDVTKRAGTVMALIAHRDWHIASFVLDGPHAATAVDWIARSRKVSPGFTELEKDPIAAREPAPVRELGRRNVGHDLVVDMSDGSQYIYNGAARRR